MIRFLVERSAVFDLKRDVTEPSVTLHDGFRGVIEANRTSIHKRVTDELRAIGFLDSEALDTSDDDVVLEQVVLVPPGLAHLGLIGPKVKICSVPEQEWCSKRVIVKKYNTAATRLTFFLCLDILVSERIAQIY